MVPTTSLRSSLARTLPSPLTPGHGGSALVRYWSFARRERLYTIARITIRRVLARLRSPLSLIAPSQAKTPGCPGVPRAMESARYSASERIHRAFRKLTLSPRIVSGIAETENELNVGALGDPREQPRQ